MKFLWIIWACGTIFNSINARRVEFTIKLQRESNHSINTLDSISKRNNVSLDVIKQNKLRDTVAHDEIDSPLSINNRLMPKIAIKHISNLSYPKNSSYAPTTRRPLMKIMKFTTKPHVIHYIHSRFQDEQSTLSITKNSNIKIQFKPQNNKANQNIPEGPDSVDDKFKTFIDIGDTGKQRDNFLATAASEKVGSVTNHSKLNTDEFRSYSKRAFEESLENIKNIRSRKNTKIHSSHKNTDPPPTQIKNNIIYIVVPSTIKNPAEILTDSEKLALVTKLAEEPINSTQLKENVFNVVNITETINTYVHTTEKSHFSKEDKSVATKIEQAVFPVIRNKEDILPTTEELIDNNSESNIFANDITTEKSYEYQAQSNKFEDSKIATNSSLTIQQSNDQTKAPVNLMPNVNIVTTKNTTVSTNMKENIDTSLKNMNKAVETEKTNENINNSLINETSIIFVTTTEKSDDFVIVANAPVNYNNVVKIEKENENLSTTENTNDFATNSEIFSVTGPITEDINSSLVNAETTIYTTTKTVTTTALTQPSNGPVFTSEKLVDYADTLENTTLSTIAKENINDFTTQLKNLSVVETTTVNTQNSLKNIDTIYSVATTEKILSSDFETNTPVTIPDVVNIVNYSSNKTENLGALETTTINTEKLSHLVTNKSDGSMHKTKKSLYHAEIVSTWPFRTADIVAAVETSGKTVLKTEKTVPLVVIVAGNSISLPELNEAISNGKIVHTNISTTKDKEKAIKYDNFSETPIISVEDEASITMAHHLALRKKRRINVIEEEGVATTSNLFKFDERDGRLTVDCTFRNIHT